MVIGGLALVSGSRSELGCRTRVRPWPTPWPADQERSCQLDDNAGRDVTGNRKQHIPQKWGDSDRAARYPVLSGKAPGTGEADCQGAVTFVDVLRPRLDRW